MGELLAISHQYYAHKHFCQPQFIQHYNQPYLPCSVRLALCLAISVCKWECTYCMQWHHSICQHSRLCYHAGHDCARSGTGLVADRRGNCWTVPHGLLCKRWGKLEQCLAAQTGPEKGSSTPRPIHQRQAGCGPIRQSLNAQTSHYETISCLQTDSWLHTICSILSTLIIEMNANDCRLDQTWQHVCWMEIEMQRLVYWCVTNALVHKI